MRHVHSECGCSLQLFGCAPGAAASAKGSTAVLRTDSDRTSARRLWALRVLQMWRLTRHADGFKAVTTRQAWQCVQQAVAGEMVIPSYFDASCTRHAEAEAAGCRTASVRY